MENKTKNQKPKTKKYINIIMENKEKKPRTKSKTKET